jgi:hypothetical protein
VVAAIPHISHDHWIRAAFDGIWLHVENRRGAPEHPSELRF